MATINPADYTNERSMIIDPDLIDAGLTNYPVRVLLNNGNFKFSESLSSGDDIVFTTADDVYTVLDYEVVYWDDTNDIAEYYVKIPSVSDTEYTRFLMLWGKASASSQENPTAVWDSNYVGVWHLGAGLTDSSGNSNTASNDGTTIENRDSGKWRAFNGSSDYLSVLNSSELTAADYFTIAIRAKTTTISALQYLYHLGADVGETTDNGAYKAYIKASGAVINNAITQDGQFNNGDDLDKGTVVANSIFNHILKNDGTNLYNIINGSIDSEASTKTVYDSTAALYIGARWDDTIDANHLSGEIQELQISNTARSAAWVKADYYNMAAVLAVREDKGKIIKVTFDREIQYTSIPNNEDNFTISGTEKRYIPGGNDVATEYTVIGLEADGLVVKKDDFTGGTETDVEVSLNGGLILEGTLGTGVVTGPTNYSTTSQSGSPNGVGFTVSNKNMYFESCTCFSENAVNIHVVIKKYNDTSTWNMSNAVTIWTDDITPSVNVWTTIPIGEVLEPGRYWIGIDENVGNALRMNFSAGGPHSGTNITWEGTVDYASGTLYPAYCYHFFSLKFAEITYPTSGSWLFPIDVDDIDDMGASLIEWTQNKPSGTSVKVYTEVNTSAVTPPTSWEQQPLTKWACMSLTLNEDLTGKYLWVKIELETTDTSETPTVSDPVFKVIKYNDQDVIKLLIDGWAGFNKAVGDITIDYDGDLGTLAGDALGHRQVADFNEDFTPDGLWPIDNPAEHEAMELDITAYTITRTLITYSRGYEAEAMELGLSNYSITRTHIDDLPP